MNLRCLLAMWVCLGLAAGLGPLGGCVGPTDASPTCAAGELLCDGECFPSTRDPRHCGACGVVCTDGRVCQDGACRDRCYGGTVDCGGGCTVLATDGANCGACGTVCGPLEHCSAGACAAGCAAGETPCSGRCANLRTDGENCGGCGLRCSWPAECYGGVCSTGDSAARRNDRNPGPSDYPYGGGPGPRPL